MSQRLIQDLEAEHRRHLEQQSVIAERLRALNTILSFLRNGDDGANTTPPPTVTGEDAIAVINKLKNHRAAIAETRKPLGHWGRFFNSHPDLAAQPSRMHAWNMALASKLVTLEDKRVFEQGWKRYKKGYKPPGPLPAIYAQQVGRASRTAGTSPQALGAVGRHPNGYWTKFFNDHPDLVLTATSRVSGWRAAVTRNLVTDADEKGFSQAWSRIKKG